MSETSSPARNLKVVAPGAAIPEGPRPTYPPKSPRGGGPPEIAGVPYDHCLRKPIGFPENKAGKMKSGYFFGGWGTVPQAGVG